MLRTRVFLIEEGVAFGIRNVLRATYANGVPSLFSKDGKLMAQLDLCWTVRVAGEERIGAYTFSCV